MLWFLVKQSMKGREGKRESGFGGVSVLVLCASQEKNVWSKKQGVSLRESRDLGYKKSRDDRDVVVRDNSMPPLNFSEIITQDTLEFGFGIHDKS